MYEDNRDKFAMLMYKIVQDEESQLDREGVVRKMCAISVKYWSDFCKKCVDKVFRPETVSVLLCNTRMHLIRMYNLKNSMPRVLFLSWPILTRFSGKQRKLQVKWFDFK